MSTKPTSASVKVITLIGLGATSFLAGLQDINAPFAPAPAAAYQTQMDKCARCKGGRQDGPDDRCEANIFGGDYCAGSCDELNHCTCREVGDCDGYAE